MLIINKVYEKLITLQVIGHNPGQNNGRVMPYQYVFNFWYYTVFFDVESMALVEPKIPNLETKFIDGCC